VRHETPLAHVPGERLPRGHRLDPGEIPRRDVHQQTLVERQAGRSGSSGAPQPSELGVQLPLLGPVGTRRGGRGKTATSMKEEDFVDKLLIASTHATPALRPAAVSTCSA